MSAPPDLETGLRDRVVEELPRAVELRRTLHREPRVSGEEGPTLRTLLRALDGIPSWCFPGHVGIARAGAPSGPAVGLRVELDALPVRETTDAPWASRNGAMHACGHDVHMAAGVALARAVHATPGAVPLVLVLQPREEQVPSGAVDVLAQGVLDGHDIAAMVGVHVQPMLPRGTVSAVAGPVNAAADTVTITVTGRPGHAAYPHRTADPVVASAHLISTLQTLVSRWADPMNPTVLTIGSIHGGESPNVVPAEVTLTGTLRTFDEAERSELASAIVKVADQVCGAHRCSAETRIDFGDPVLLNDADLVRHTLPRLAAAGLEPGTDLRSCGADDFANYCPHYPSLMIFTGAGSGPSGPGLHHPSFLPSEDDIDAVVRSMLAGYLGAVDRLRASPSSIPFLPSSGAMNDLVQ
ncbi:M20 family metallopeptidase [Streptomyces sp. NPDC052077]|uniref:M20 metallopeptidase family protein n=1 Tax=Streptomyces sp. NPDC052077 TaxID=3154757 RepID=UPI00341B88CF